MKCSRRGTAVKVSLRRLESISYSAFSVCMVLFPHFTWLFQKYMIFLRQKITANLWGYFRNKHCCLLIISNPCCIKPNKKIKWWCNPEGGGPRQLCTEKIYKCIYISAKLRNLSYIRSLFCILTIVRHCHWLMCPVGSWASLVIF